MEKTLKLYESTFEKEQKDQITHLNIDPIRTDLSNRKCARIKFHLEKMTQEQIKNLQVKTRREDLSITKIVPMEYGLLVEITASDNVPIYIKSEELGESDPITLDLEPDEVYRIKGTCDQSVSINITSIPNVEVSLDGVYKGHTSKSGKITIPNVKIGPRKVKLTLKDEEPILRTIEVTTTNITFSIMPSFSKKNVGTLTFQITPVNSDLYMGPYKCELDSMGNYKQSVSSGGLISYNVQAENHYTKTDEFYYNGGDSTIVLHLDPQYGFLDFSKLGNGISVFLDGDYVGKTPLQNQRKQVRDTVHRIEFRKPYYKTVDKLYTVNSGETYFLAQEFLPNYGTFSFDPQTKDNVNLYINEELIPLSALQKRKFYPGVYKIKVTRDLFFDYTDSVTLDIGRYEIRPEWSANFGEVEIDMSNFSDVEIFFDNLKNDTIPVTHIFKLTPGEHKLRLSRKYYKDYKESFEVSIGDKRRITPKFDSDHGLLYYTNSNNVDTRETLFYLDEVNLPLPLTEVNSLKLSPGNHTIKMVRPLYKVYQKKISVNVGDTIQSEFPALIPDFAEITFESETPDVDFYIDNQKKYTGSVYTYKLVTGTHVIRIEKEDYLSIEKIILVTAEKNGTKEHFDALQRKLGKISITSDPGGALVYNDRSNEFCGTTPLLLEHIAPGNYDFSISFGANYPKKKCSVTLENGEIVKKHVTRTRSWKDTEKPLFSHNFDFFYGYQFYGGEYNPDNLTYELTYSFGLNTGIFSYGLGLGYSSLDDVPLFLWGSLYFSKKRIQPFLSLSTGLYLADAKFLCKVGLGINFRIFKRMGIHLIAVAKNTPIPYSHNGQNFTLGLSIGISN